MWQDSGDPPRDGPGDVTGVPHLRVAAAMREQIATLRPGERLPSVRALVTEFGVASATASRAMAVLRSEGLVESIPRVGTVVARPGARPRIRPRIRPQGTKPSSDVVAALAVELADTDGLAAVSMRRLAAELGVATMTVHGAVGGKDELVTAMLEQVFSAGFPPRIDPGAGWRAQLGASAHHQWSVYSRHPWAARAVALHRPQPVPSLLALTEWHLTALEEVTEDPERRFDLHVVLVGYVRGMAITLAAEGEARIDTGVDAETWIDHDPATLRGMRRHAGPAMRRAGPYVYDLDRAFRTGLTTILDGIT